MWLECTWKLDNCRYYKAQKEDYSTQKDRKQKMHAFQTEFVHIKAQFEPLFNCTLDIPSIITYLLTFV